MRGSRGQRDDRGAFLIFFGVLLVALLVITGLVIDVGRVHAARRSGQSAVDLAVLAGVQELSRTNSAEQACRVALTTYLTNVPGAPSSTSVPCGDLPATCDDSTASVTVTDGGTADPYSIQITYPVSDADINDPNVPGGLRADDGQQCERMGMDFDRVLDSYFAGVVGVDEFTTAASAVARRDTGLEGAAPNLWLLDPTGCTVLNVQGGSRVIVGSSTLAGLVTLDSDGSTCASNAYTIDAGGTGSRIQAIPTSGATTGRIQLHAMRRGQTTCATGNLRACQQSDVTGGMITPQPTRRATRATRAAVDHRYDCRTTYPDYMGIEITGCTTGTSPYVTNLRSAVGGSGAPAGFQRWTSSYSCAPSGTITASGNWWVDCDNFRLNSGATVNFTGGNVVFQRDVTLQSGRIQFNTANPSNSLPSNCLTAVTGCTDSSAASAAFVFVRGSGNISATAGGVFNANHAAVFLDQGYLDLAGGASPVWSAPTEGPFRGLALWADTQVSSATTRFKLTGGSSMSLQGAFFTPYANAFTLSGGTPLTPQLAQFISYRLDISGGASLTLTPGSNDFVTVDATGALLIR